jgi:hypothetical protein
MNAISVSCIRITALMVVALAIGLPSRSEAGVILFDTFLQFATSGVGLATGCQPADPNGPFCIPSSGTLTDVLDAPPWTFTAPSVGATLIVTDVLLAGDRFEVFDFGTSLGLTSLPSTASDCGDDPVVCLADPNISSRAFNLAAGNHEITIYSVTDGLATGYLTVNAVPEPSTSTLLIAAALGIFALQRRRRRRSP